MGKPNKDNMADKKFDSCFLESVAKSSEAVPKTIDQKTWLVNGEIKKWAGKSEAVYSPVLLQKTDEKILLGYYPMLTEKEAMEAIDAAHKAYDYGQGKWPQTSSAERIKVIEQYVAALKKKRDEIVSLIMWEICKTAADPAKEVDRTIDYILDTIKAFRDLENKDSKIIEVSGVISQVRRAPYGVVLCVGPFNYPFNETYTTLIPALIMGNAVVMKLPRTGVLCHYPTFELFAKIFPPGVVNIISGSGRETMPPLMASGKLDVFAFIGTSAAASDLQKAHPHPHRLRVCLGLEAKNPAIVLPDASLDLAVDQCVKGAFSYNGQRCTALKILFVHESIIDKFLEAFTKAVDELKMGLPWDKSTSITPLPEQNKPKYLQKLIDDALSKGAKIVNKRVGVDRTFVAPTVLYPVNKSMKVFHEEQFGPLCPIASFKEDKEIFQYLAESQYGQQASVFSDNPERVGSFIDILVNQVSRVNINSYCQRGPDVLPFTGRKDSAFGTLSVFDALRVFSIRSLVAATLNKENAHLFNKIIEEKSSKFLRMDHIFSHL